MKKNSSLNFNWYPGHIAKAEKELREKIKIIDLIIEVRDARIAFSSAHKDLQDWASGKNIITVLSKIDLADPKKIPQEFIGLNLKENKLPSTLFQKIKESSKDIVEKYKAKGIKNRPIKIMVLGYPNTGKSTLINRLSKTKKARVENRAGVTRQQQWIDVKSLNNQDQQSYKLLDTPGIIPSKFYSEEQALKLALCNCLSDKAFDYVEIARKGIELIDFHYKDLIKTYYAIEDEICLEAIARKKSLIRDSEPELLKAAELFINDFRRAKFGKICLC
jgi:ribosome biogenesis GTPase A